MSLLKQDMNKQEDGLALSYRRKSLIKSQDSPLYARLRVNKKDTPLR
ncbi:hypothetical protein GCM10010965_17940 [Caldalkalibacillus thermarum]|nr:hypothetical protein GCM10010965_17940 [Caldalkalibacillus thermarum]